MPQTVSITSSVFSFSMLRVRPVELMHWGWLSGAPFIHQLIVCKLHQDNKPVQYKAIFYGSKNVIKCDCFCSINGAIAIATIYWYISVWISFVEARTWLIVIICRNSWRKSSVFVFSQEHFTEHLGTNEWQNEFYSPLLSPHKYIIFWHHFASNLISSYEVDKWE